MPATLPNDDADAHRVIPETRRDMLRADLRKPESRDMWAEIGACLDFARRFVGWTLDELAGKLPPPAGSEKRDPRQVSRWIRGEERTPVDVVMAVDVLQEPFVVALAKLAKFEVVTTLRKKRSA